MISINAFTDHTKPISIYKTQEEWRVLSLFIKEFAPTFVWGAWAYFSATVVPLLTCDQDERCESSTIKVINMLALLFIFASAYESKAEEYNKNSKSRH